MHGQSNLLRSSDGDLRSKPSLSGTAYEACFVPLTENKGLDDSTSGSLDNRNMVLPRGGLLGSALQITNYADMMHGMRTDLGCCIGMACRVINPNIFTNALPTKGVNDIHDIKRSGRHKRVTLVQMYVHHGVFRRENRARKYEVHQCSILRMYSVQYNSIGIAPMPSRSVILVLSVFDVRVIVLAVDTSRACGD